MLIRGIKIIRGDISYFYIYICMYVFEGKLGRSKMYVSCLDDSERGGARLINSLERNWRIVGFDRARELLEIGRPNSRESGGDLEGESERRGFIYLYPLQLRAGKQRI